MKEVHEQIEAILDERSGRRVHSVIIRMKSDAKERKPLLHAASFRAVQQQMTQNARDLIPTVKRRKGKPMLERSAEARRHRVPAELPSATKAQVKRRAGRSMKALRSEPEIARHEDSKTRGALATFTASRSALLRLTTDDLGKLREKASEIGPGIGDIYLNRTLSIPRVARPKSLPANVTDNKVSAWGVNAIGAMSVWGAFGSRGSGVRVAVLDTGIDASHPDLDGKVAAWAEFDENGAQVPGSQPHDSDEHGTHVAGTVAGGNASGQHIGVAPAAELAGGLVLSGGGGTDAQVLAGIDWAFFDASADVINMSLGGLTLGPEVPSTYMEAILTCVQGGVPVVTAIGNEGSQTSGSPGNDLFAFAVGATDPLDRSAGFSGGRTQIIFESNFIRDQFLPLPYSKPDVSAPGVAVVSSVPGGEWEAFNGTSMATPHVAGAIALLLSATKIRTQIPAPQRAFFIQDLMTGSTEELGESGQDHRFGFGRIDILRAVGFARAEGL